jgi:dUTP pyrophosphatase
MNHKLSEEHTKMHVNNIHVHSGERLLVGTGLYIALPKGYVADVRPRSGRALKEGLDVANSPGTIDSDYRGEICVILTNHSHVPIYINKGEKIAQLVILKHEKPTFTIVENLPDTERGEGGFGSTGK